MQPSDRLTAELNDLLRLDLDAVQAYTIAIAAIENETLGDTLRLFRADHERHVEELERLVAGHGGTAVPVPHVSGAFKAAVQAAAALANDDAILTALRMNERQLRDRYARASLSSHGLDVQRFLRRAVADETHHFGWVTQVLRQMGHRTDDVEAAFSGVHVRFADTLEAGERSMMRMGARASRAVREGDARMLMSAGIAMLGGLALGRRLFS